MGGMAMRLGKQVRMIRRRANLTQAAMAERLGISPSYLNLIEREHRKLSASLLLKLAQQFDVDLRSFASSEWATLIAELTEALSDPVFQNQPINPEELQDLVTTCPDTAKAVRQLYQVFRAARDAAQGLAEQMHERQDAGGMDRVELFTEQVSDMVQRHRNCFPALEEAAERIWRDARLEPDGLFRGLRRHLEDRHGIRVRVATVDAMAGAVRRFDPERAQVLLSEGLNYESRIFQLAHQIALLDCNQEIERMTLDPLLTSEASRRLGRVALANYFAGALVMPYPDFLNAARKERYDIDLLCHRFRCSFEQVCHRLTTLRRPGDEGVSFSMVRVDIAGNISKKFSTESFRYPRFSGLCPLRNVHLAFLQPGQFRVQVSRLPDGKTFFSVARTVRKNRGGFLSPSVRYAIGLGCDLDSARHLIYSEGMDLSPSRAAVPVGVTCRLCPRMDCESRAFPSIQEPLEINENRRGLSFYAPVKS